MPGKLKIAKEEKKKKKKGVRFTIAIWTDLLCFNGKLITLTSVTSTKNIYFNKY